MNTELLKKKILDLAIKGKLVEQRAEEGTAEELYAQIQEEKQKLIKEGKLKKEKPLAPITDKEIPFDIPKSWKWVKLGDIGNWASGSTPSRNNPEYYGKGYSWLKTGDLNDGYVEYIPENITDLALKQCSLRLNPVGSILIAMYGATVGKLGILKIPATTNQACCACIPHIIYNLYLFYFLLSQKSNFINKGAGGAQPNISKEKIINSLFPLPPLAEQKRIVAKIEELFLQIDLIEKNQKDLISLTALTEKKILDLAMKGKLVEQRAEEGTAEELYAKIQEEKKKLISEGKIKKEKPLPEITEDEIPFDIPESWKWVRIGDLANYKKGPFGSALTKSIFVHKSEESIKVYEQKNAIQKDANLGFYHITRDYFEEKMKSFEVVSGDIIVSCAGTIGEIYRLPENIEKGIINQALMRIKLFEPTSSDYYELLFDYLIKDYSRKSSKGSAIKNIPPFDILKNYVIPLPPLAEQKRIVAKIEELKAIVKKLE